MPDVNGDCENCTKGREAVSRCPCSCGRWLCRRCLRQVRHGLRWGALTRADRELIVAAVSALPLLLDVVEAAQHIREFVVSWEALIPGDIRELTDALDRWEDSDAR